MKKLKLRTPPPIVSFIFGGMILFYTLATYTLAAVKGLATATSFFNMILFAGIGWILIQGGIKDRRSRRKPQDPKI